LALASEKIYTEALFQGLEPDPILTVSDWADEHRYLSQVSSAEAGKWKTSRTPYLREIMDCLSVTSNIQEIYFMKGTQVGGTECGNNWIGYIIDQAPGPTLSVMPRLEDAKKNSKIRIKPLIESTPRLRDKVQDARSRDSGNTILQKEFPGGVFVMAGANSAAGLRSMPIRNLFFDEESEYPGDVDDEGDPVELAKKRTDTFSSKKKIFHVSTPLVEGRCRIEAGYNKTDQRKFFVPCPTCGHMQWFKWDSLKWEKLENGRPDYNSVYYECENENCKAQIKNWQKTKMLANGEWRATSESTDDRVRGYHLSGLYSPVGWFSWSDCVRQWYEANNPKNLDKLKSFVNTVLGETWKDKGEAPEWEKLYKRRENYGRNELPNGVCFLTAGVDIQADRIEVEVVGWGRNKRSWSVDYRVFEGNTSSIDSAPWRDLTSCLGEYWETESGVELDIKVMAIDSGYSTQTVYSYVKQFSIRRVIAIKGSDTQSVILNQGTPVDIRKGNRKRIRRATKVFTVGVSKLKQELYGWLKLEYDDELNEHEPYGFCHFPEYDQEHFKRLTSETLEIKWVRGFKKHEWVADGRNEQLDCRVYARAAASYCGIDRFKEPKWDALESEAGVTIKRQTQENMAKSKNKKKKVAIKRRKSTVF